MTIAFFEKHSAEFWSNNRRRIFGAGFSAYKLCRDPDDISWEHVRRRALELAEEVLKLDGADQLLAINPRTAQNFIRYPDRGWEPLPAHLLILLSVCDQLGRRPGAPTEIIDATPDTGKLPYLDQRSDAEREALRQTLALGRELERNFQKWREKQGARTTGQGDTPSGLGLYAALHAPADDHGAGALAQFFPQVPSGDPTSYACFDSFRYDLDEGWVHKAFLAIGKPKAPGLPCTFGHFYGKRMPQVRGTIIALPDEFLFVGTSNGRLPHSEVISVPVVAGDRDDFDALAMTTNVNERRRLAACTVLVRTATTHHVPEETGLFRADEVLERPELRALDIRDRLRNIVPFKLETDIRIDDKPRRQKDMVAEVARVLDGRITVGGREFNPADSEFYTYNSALRLRGKR